MADHIENSGRMFLSLSVNEIPWDISPLCAISFGSTTFQQISCDVSILLCDFIGSKFHIKNLEGNP